MARVHQDGDPYRGGKRVGEWPAKWVADQAAFDNLPRVVAYRLRFAVECAERRRVHVSADERYELWLDGVRIGRGPERGDRLNWFFESYDLELEPGEHVLVARTWWLGEKAPYAQMSVRHGFLCAGEGMHTGEAGWELKRLGGYEWLPWGHAWGCGAKVRMEGSEVDWGWEAGEGEGWSPVVPLGQAVTHEANDRDRDWRLRPAVLPAMMEAEWGRARVRHVAEPPLSKVSERPFWAADHLAAEAEGWQQVVSGLGAVVVPPRTRRRVLIDLDDYVCAYPEVVTRGGKGSRVRMHWLESLYERLPGHGEWIAAMPKGDRDAVEGKFFSAGVGDEWRPDGGSGRRFDTLWWEAGRFVELIVETGEEELVVEAVRFRETRYPLEFETEFAASDARLEKVTPIALRALAASSHEVYNDSPYYEQIMYVGDARNEALVTYLTCADTRLPRKAVELVGASRLPDGLTQSRYPSRVTQNTFGFAVWWIGMVLDYALYRGDAAFVRAQMTGVRHVLEGLSAYVAPEGVLRVPLRPNFCFLDWASGWHDGPPVDSSGLSAGFSFQVALGFRMAARLEEMVGEPELAARCHRRADEIVAACEVFWKEDRGLYADNPSGDYSEHAQVLALLAGGVGPEREARMLRGLVEAPDLARCTIFFTHYLFEVFAQHGMIGPMLERMQLWVDLTELGLRALPEGNSDHSRSDCHGWGAHVVAHYLGSILGIRPGGFGFEEVVVQPGLGSLEWAWGSLVHPRGMIRAEFRREGSSVVGVVELPEGVRGRCGDQGLLPGSNQVVQALC